MLTEEIINALLTNGLTILSDMQRLLTDDDGNIVLNLYIENFIAQFNKSKYDDSPAALNTFKLNLTNALATGLTSPYIFNRVLHPEISIYTKETTIKDAKGKLSSKESKSAKGFLGAIDSTLIKGTSEKSEKSSSRETTPKPKPITEIASLLLSRPVEVHEKYFKRVLATLLREAKKSVDFAARQEIVGNFASLLIGIDALQILEDLHQKYLVHGERFEKATSSEGEGLTGFLPWHFLPLRILFALQIYVDLQLGIIDEDQLTTVKSFFKLEDNDQACVRMTEELYKELKRDLQTYWITRSGYYIHWNWHKVEGQKGLLDNMCKGVVSSIQKMQEDESMVIYLAWGPDKVKDRRGKKKVADEEGHALYLQIHKQDGQWNLLIHNLGQKSELHTHKDERYAPYPLARLTALDWAVNEEGTAAGAGFKYIHKLLESMYTSEGVVPEVSQAYPIYYDLATSREKILPAHSSINMSLYQPQSGQGIVSNCMYANHESARSYHLPIGWLRRQEMIRSGNASYEGIFPKLDVSLLQILNSDPCDETFPRTKSRERNAMLIANAAEALKQAYRRNYKVIPPFSSVWDSEEPLDMHSFYVELQLVEHSSLEEGEASVSQRIIDLDELLKTGGQQRIVGPFGSGKTTLFQNIAYRWAHVDSGERIGKEYPLLILFPLRRLKSLKIIGDTPEQKVASCIAQYYFEQEFDKESLANFANKIFASGQKVMWLLDGFDEVASGLTVEQKAVMDFVMGKQEHVFVSTRPTGLQHDDANKPHIIVKGLSDKKIEEWIRIHLERDAETEADRASIASQTAEFIKRLQANPRIWELVHYPINLKMVCMAFINNRLDTELKTSTQIYAALCNMMADIHQSKMETMGSYPDAQSFWAPLEELLSVLSFQILDKDQQEVSVELLLSVIPDFIKYDFRRNWVDEVIHSGLLKLTLSSREGELVPLEFIHSSFHEYFAAKYIIRFMQTQTEEFLVWFKNNKNKARFEVVWRFVSGLLSDPALANHWFLLWLDYPIRLNLNGQDQNYFAQLSELLQESPARGQLPLRDDLIAFVVNNWGESITQLPKDIAKLMHATQLWSHPKAKPLVNQLIEGVYDWNYRSLPNKKYIVPAMNSEKTKEFLGWVEDASRLLKDIHEIDPALLTEFYELFRSQTTLEEFKKKLPAVVSSKKKPRKEGSSTSDDGEIVLVNDLKLRESENLIVLKLSLSNIPVEASIFHRRRYLVAILMAKMKIHTKEVINQLEDALIFAHLVGHEKEQLIRLVVGAVDQTKLRSVQLNNRLLLILKNTEHDGEHEKTRLFILGALSEQAVSGQTDTILRELTQLLESKETPVMIKFLLQIMSKHRYQDKAYLDRLIALINVDEFRDDVLQTLKYIKEYAPEQVERIDVVLAAHPSLPVKVKELMPEVVLIKEDVDAEDLISLLSKTMTELKQIHDRQHESGTPKKSVSKLPGAAFLSGKKRPRPVKADSEDYLAQLKKKTKEQLLLEYRQKWNMFNQGVAELISKKIGIDEALLKGLIVSPSLKDANANVLISQHLGLVFSEPTIYQNLRDYLLDELIDSIEIESKKSCYITLKNRKVFNFNTEQEVYFWQEKCHVIGQKILDVFCGKASLPLPSMAKDAMVINNRANVRPPFAGVKRGREQAFPSQSSSGTLNRAGLGWNSFVPQKTLKNKLHDRFSLNHVPVTGDGNCQFRAVAKQLQVKNLDLYTALLGLDSAGSGDDEIKVARVLRGMCVDHMRAHREDYEHFNAQSLGVRGVNLAQDTEFKTFDEYLTHIATDNEFVGNLTLSALARTIGMDLLLLTDDLFKEGDGVYKQYLDQYYFHSGIADAFNPDNTLIITYNGVDHYETVSNESNQAFVNYINARIEAEHHEIRVLGQ